MCWVIELTKLEVGLKLGDPFEQAGDPLVGFNHLTLELFDVVHDGS